MASARTHLIVSPHFDDGVLSCGPFISNRLRAGDRVIVATVFTRSADRSFPLPPAAAQDYERTGGDPMPLRWDEDAKAARVLGHETRSLGHRDLIFRVSSTGKPRVQSLDDIFGPLIDDDLAVADDVASSLEKLWADVSPDVVHSPLGTGNHIDHVVVRKAVESVAATRNDAELVHYDDMPYALTEPLTGEAPSWDVHGEDIDRWLDAVACYTTQIENMFDHRDWRSEFRLWAQLLPTSH